VVKCRRFKGWNKIYI